MNRIRKSFTFEAAHQLERAFSKECSDCIHGHSYTVEMFLKSGALDSDAMVMDFGVLKGFKKIVMDSWDHGLLLHEDKKPHYMPLIEAGLLKREKVSFLTRNPTAETMARMLYKMLWDFVTDAHVIVEKVRVHETSTGWAECDGL